MTPEATNSRDLQAYILGPNWGFKMDDVPEWVQKELEVARRTAIIGEKLSRRAWLVAALAAMIMTTPVVFSSHENWSVVGGMAGLLFVGLGLALKLGAKGSISTANRKREALIALAEGRPDPREHPDT